MENVELEQARRILAISKPIIRIHGVGGRPWKRNVAKGARIGPWLQADYEILDDAAWRRKGACLYLLRGGDAGIRYVGISRNGVKHRWRTSPAFDADTMARLPRNQLFHSQCWRHVEAESSADGGATFEVRSIASDELLEVLKRIGPPLSAFALLGDDGESIVAAVERWMCNRRSHALARWNVAMAS